MAEQNNSKLPKIKLVRSVQKGVGGSWRKVLKLTMNDEMVPYVVDFNVSYSANDGHLARVGITILTDDVTIVDELMEKKDGPQAQDLRSRKRKTAAKR